MLIINVLRCRKLSTESNEKMNLSNARAEGDSNKDNDQNFRGSKGIILKHEFRKPIRSQRCLIVASAFIEGRV